MPADIHLLVFDTGRFDDKRFGERQRDILGLCQRVDVLSKSAWRIAAKPSRATNSYH